MVHLNISLRVRTRSIKGTNARRRGGPDGEVQAETETRGLGLQIERTNPNTENQIPSVRREELSAVIPVSATASAAASSTSALTSSQSSSASAVSLISSQGSSAAAAAAASQADNTAMSFSKSKSNTSSAFSSAAAASYLPHNAGAKILILSPESAVVFLKAFLDRVFAGDAKPGSAWLDGAGDGQGTGPNWEMEMLADLADARSKSGAKMKQLEEAISAVGGQGWQEPIAQQEVESAKWFKELRDSQICRDRDATARNAR